MTVVSDELLRGYIRELREALGDDAKKARYIETVTTRGYRFLLRVESQEPNFERNQRRDWSMLCDLRTYTTRMQ